MKTFKKWNLRYVIFGTPGFILKVPNTKLSSKRFFSLFETAFEVGNSTYCPFFSGSKFKIGLKFATSDLSCKTCVSIRPQNKAEKRKYFSFQTNKKSTRVRRGMRSRKMEHFIRICHAASGLTSCNSTIDVRYKL